jgi:hypothetical protein
MVFPDFVLNVCDVHLLAFDVPTWSIYTCYIYIIDPNIFSISPDGIMCVWCVWYLIFF